MPPIDAALDGGNLHLLLDHIADAVFATDAANRVTQWTESAERMFGYSAAEALGRPFEELLPYRMAQPGDEGEFLATLEAGQTWRGQGTVRVRDGHEIWIESTVEPIISGGRLVGSVSVARDVTATVEAQRKLADEERFVEAVLGATEALVVVLDSTGQVVRLNRACERMSGYPPAEVLGRPFWDVLFPSDEVEQVRAELSDLQAAAFPNTHESHWMTVTGELRLIRWENACLTDDRGAVTHVIATGIDITEARRGDDALQGIEVVGRLLAEQGPVASALDAVLSELETRMGYRLLSLYLVDGASLRLGAQRGYTAAPERLDVGRGVIGRVYRSGVAELVRNVNSDPDYVSGEDGVVSEIAAPILGDGTVLGVLNIEARRPERMTPDDLRLARAIADRLSGALLHNHAQQALSDRVRLFAALAEFAAAMNAIREPGRLADALVDAVNAVVPSDTVVIATLDRSDGRYLVSALRGFAPGAMGAIIEPGDGTVGRAISERALILTEHAPGAPSSAALRDYRQRATRWAVAVPLINEGSVLGVISLGRFAAFTQAEREVIALLGSHAALALANAKLVEEVSALAIHDGLTGLYNRRHFDAELDHAIARFRRRTPTGNLAAIMFDLDHFGDFNRRHGHLVGDAMLRLFAGVLDERLRSADLVARYGGEEFVVILEDSALPEVVRVADEVRRGLEARTVPDADGRAVRATVSAGCAVIDPADPTKEALLSRADGALFMAKRAGRNKVVAA
ncbi:MAG: diguanylate cyclase [Candidatus Limnocylindrales bacterium]|jgi:diguanylate cyclase (GGDEF)-like protein/PAS domain S-box-containing protein